MGAEWSDAARRLTGNVTVLAGPNNGGFPSGNTLVVRGAGETVVIDPSITVVERGGVGARVDAVVNSHSHEDHMAGNGLFPSARVHVHHHDLAGVRSLDGLMEVYGVDRSHALAAGAVEQFHYTPRPDAVGFADGHVFDLGGVTVEAVHLPGHTRGHSGFRITGGVFFLSDIDLTGFGPYYGDIWSDLEDFEASLEKLRHEEADYYVTFHHKGVVEGRPEFLRLLAGFREVIHRRHDAMLRYLAEPRTLEEMAGHGFIYRPGQESAYTAIVERRSAELHLRRMLRRGEAAEVGPGRYRRTGPGAA